MDGDVAAKRNLDRWLMPMELHIEELRVKFATAEVWFSFQRNAKHSVNTTSVIQAKYKTVKQRHRNASLPHHGTLNKPTSDELHRDGVTTNSYDLKEIKYSPGKPLSVDQDEARVVKLKAEKDAAKAEMKRIEVELKIVEDRHQEFVESIFVILKAYREGVETSETFEDELAEQLGFDKAKASVLGGLLRVVTDRATTGNNRTRIPPVLMEFALSVYSISKSAYNEARSFIKDLPSIDSIIRERAKGMEGDSTTKNVARLVAMADEAGLKPEERVGGLLVDEMNIKCVSLELGLLLNQ
jgi:hypothetical protein